MFNIFFFATTLIFLGRVDAGYAAIRISSSYLVDAQRVQDLKNIQEAITEFYAENGRRPENLQEVKDATSSSLRILDPITRQPYEYKVDYFSYPDGSEYDLCANFEAPSPLIIINITPPCHGICLTMLNLKVINPFYSNSTGTQQLSGFWDHPIGRQCWVSSYKNPYLY